MVKTLLAKKDKQKDFLLRWAPQMAAEQHICNAAWVKGQSVMLRRASDFCIACSGFEHSVSNLHRHLVQLINFLRARALTRYPDKK